MPPPLARLLLTAPLRRAGRGGASALVAGGSRRPLAADATYPASAANAASAAVGRRPHPSPAPFSWAASGVGVTGLGWGSDRTAPGRAFASAAANAAPKKRAAPKAKTPAAAAAPPRRRSATPSPPPPPPPAFPILSTADGQDPFTAFTEAAGEAFASAFGWPGEERGGGSGGGGGGAWTAFGGPSPSSTPTPTSDPLTAGLAALASPWLTPTQRQELVDGARAAWAAWGFPDPAGPDLAGAAAGFGTDGRAPDPKAAAAREAVLDAALAHVPALGWTDAALAAGAASAGLSRGAAALPTRGAADLVLHFIGRANADLKKKLAGGGVVGRGGRGRGQKKGGGKAAGAGVGAPADPAARVTSALRSRLEALTPHAATWPTALAALATTPGAPPAAAALLAAMVDDVLHAGGGDTSAGADWYLKRAALSAVYAAAELHLVADGSPGWEETWAFLERGVRGALGLVG